jgi:hypothetical protein
VDDCQYDITKLGKKEKKHTGFAGLGFFLPLQRPFIAPPLFYIILPKKRHCLLAYLQFACFHTVYTVFRNDEIFKKKEKNLKC